MFCRVDIGKTSYLKISDVIIVPEIHFATGHFLATIAERKRWKDALCCCSVSNFLPASPLESTQSEAAAAQNRSSFLHLFGVGLNWLQFAAITADFLHTFGVGNCLPRQYMSDDR
jgi:hypothetical protein